MSPSELASHGAAGLVVLAALGVAPRASADDPPRPGWTFVVGPDFDMESGVRSTTGLGRTLFSYDDLLAAEPWLDERRAEDKALGVAGRFAKSFFVDIPMVLLQLLVEHEVFGHGARGREAGLAPSYQFHLVPPYSWLFPSEGDWTGFTDGSRTGALERDIGMTIAGIEANYWGAWWLTLDAVHNDGWISYHDLLQYFAAKLTNVWNLQHVQSPAGEPGAGGDPGQYVTELQLRFNRWRPSDRHDIAERLRYAYVYNFVDPTFWQAAYHVAITYLYEGKRDAELLTIPLWGAASLYPTTRFNLSPFGAEHYLDLFLHDQGRTFEAYGRVGSSGLAPYGGAGARARGLRPGLGLSLGAALDVWSQPEMLFEARNVFNRPTAVGFNAALDADWHIYGPLLTTGKLAAKTRGYLMGQPLEAGLYGYAGITLAPGAEGALLGP